MDNNSKFVLLHAGGRAAARTLPLRCVVPMATHTQADVTLMPIRGGANCRITPGPHTQLFEGARHPCFLFFCFYRQPWTVLHVFSVYVLFV